MGNYTFLKVRVSEIFEPYFKNIRKFKIIIIFDKGAYYWVAVNDKLEPGYPKLAKETWNGLPNKIDAAFSYKNDEVLFFSGPAYWKYTTTKLEPGYPRLISDGFPGIPDNIQAASVWGKNGLIYFFKGTGVQFTCKQN